MIRNAQLHALSAQLCVFVTGCAFETLVLAIAPLRRYNRLNIIFGGERRVNIIDGHMHTKYFPENWFTDCARARGYSAYAILSLSCMSSFGGAANNEQCLAVKRADPTRAYFFAGLTHPCGDYAAHVRYWLDRGADGIKLIETKPTVWRETGVDLSDARFDPMFDYLERTGTPVLWHVGDPAAFWHRDQAPEFAFRCGWFYGDGGYPALEELYAVTERVLQRHPRLHACLAHLYFCGDDRAHAERILDTYENVRLDITPGVEMYEHFERDLSGWRDFFLKYQDRIQLGTDTDMGDAFDGPNALTLALSMLGSGPVQNFGSIWSRGLDLPEPVIRKIAADNFRAFAGQAPKPL